MATPETDAMTLHHNDGIPSDFCRDLERRLNAMNFKRPYDCYWSRRALVAEAKLKSMLEEMGA